MEFSIAIVLGYLADMQGALLILCAVWAAALFGRRVAGSRPVALIVPVNLLVSGAFFMTHTYVTPYYLMPLIMLSLWTLLFDHVMQEAPARLQEPLANPAE